MIILAKILFVAWALLMLAAIVLSFPGIRNENVKAVGWQIGAYGLLFGVVSMGAMAVIKVIQGITL